tara:strand:- start:100 stop:693 length:594 start_codon:yes stop_codon:yes gene_type:complete
MEAIDIVLEGAIKLGVNKKGQSELIKFVLDNPKYHYSIVTNHRNLTHIMHDISGLMRDDEFFVPRVLFDDDNEYKKIEQMKENKLIAEFMGYENVGTLNNPMYDYYDNDFQDGSYEVKDLCYHKSWDWLMPVVEEIESLGYTFEKNFQRIDKDWQCLIVKGNDILYQEFNTDSRIACYQVVVEFINEYNRTDDHRNI